MEPSRDDVINIILNGQTKEIPKGMTVADLISSLALQPERIALELNLTILARPLWHETLLMPKDRLEIVHFVGGGEMQSK